MTQNKVMGKITGIYDDKIVITVTTNEKDEEGNYKYTIIPCFMRRAVKTKIIENCEINDIINVNIKEELFDGIEVNVITKINFILKDKERKEK